MPVPTIEQPIARKPIVITQNAEFRLSLCHITYDETGAGTVTNTTGWVVKMQVRAKPMETSPVLMEASTANGRIVVGINGLPGEQVNIDITVPASVTALIEDVGDAGYDIRVTYPEGSPDYLLKGDAFIDPAYTW